MVNGRPDWEMFRKQFDCPTHDFEIRQRIYRGGQVSWWEQCRVCGEKGRNLKNTDLPAGVRGRAIPFDEDVANRRYRETYDEFKRLSELLKDSQDEEWWDWYNNYLLSPEWSRKRDLVLRRANGICEGCGLARATQVHHKTYERVGHEMLFDLVAICSKCHEAIPHKGAA